MKNIIEKIKNKKKAWIIILCIMLVSLILGAWIYHSLVGFLFISIVIGGFIYLLGAIQLLYPEEMYFLFAKWQFRKEPELSDGYFIYNALVSLFMMGLGIFSMAGGAMLL